MGKIRSRQLVVLALLTAVTVVLTVEILIVASSAHAGFQVDYKGDLYGAALAIRHGANPYHPALLQAEAKTLRDGGHLGLTISPRYPPISMLAVLPLSFLPFMVGAAIFLLLSTAAVIAALWLFGVRDWRCFVIALISAPTAYGLWIGQLTPWLLLATALTWRARDRIHLMALAGALAITLKLFLWPLGAWMLVTRRYRQLALTIVYAIGGIMVAWAIIGFAGLTSYPQLLIDVAYIGELRGSSLVTLLLGTGLSTTAARAVAILITASLAAAAWRLKRLPDGEARAFGLIVVATLVASPVVWVHYLVLLFVPIALLSPRLSVLWFLPGLASFAAAQNVLLEFTVIAVTCAPLLRSAAVAAANSPSSRRWHRARRATSLASFLLAPIRPTAPAAADSEAAPAA